MAVVQDKSGVVRMHLNSVDEELAVQRRLRIHLLQQPRDEFEKECVGQEA
jgi:hypothetical protein